jgi:hypothetical protein
MNPFKSYNRAKERENNRGIVSGGNRENNSFKSYNSLKKKGRDHVVEYINNDNNFPELCSSSNREREKEKQRKEEEDVCNYKKVASIVLDVVDKTYVSIEKVNKADTIRFNDIIDNMIYNWEKYKIHYIETYGEDIYEKMYSMNQDSRDYDSDGEDEYLCEFDDEDEYDFYD